jgi:hypothetical protein
MSKLKIICAHMSRASVTQMNNAMSYLATLILNISHTSAVIANAAAMRRTNDWVSKTPLIA